MLAAAISFYQHCTLINWSTKFFHENHLRVRKYWPLYTYFLHFCVKLCWTNLDTSHASSGLLDQGGLVIRWLPAAGYQHGSLIYRSLH